jgi:hypothetical protein
MMIPNPVFFYQLIFYFSKPQVRRLITKIEKLVIKWPYLSTTIHSFGGKEFNLNKQEIGHIHWNGDLDIMFKNDLVRELIRQGLAGEHRFVPGKAVTFKLRSESDVERAINLLRLSYLIHTKNELKNDQKLKAVNLKEIEGLPFNGNILDLIVY